MKKIKDWSILLEPPVQDNVFTAVSTWVQKLEGDIIDKETRVTSHIKTSSIIKIDFKKNIIETENSIYKLGSPNQEWISYLSQNGLSKKYFENLQKLD
jgi:hypothetical protein